MSLLEVNDLPALRARLRDADITALEIDLDGCDTKAVLMQRCAARLQWPKGFGHNWDALLDALREGVQPLIDRRGVAAVVVSGTRTLLPEVTQALHGVLLDLTTGYAAEACLAYWVGPRERVGRAA